MLTSRVNERLANGGVIARLCEGLGTYIRYGVSSDLAIELLTAGIRSRELASNIADIAVREGVLGYRVREWLGDLPLSTWRTQFAATELDILDLIEYARPRSSTLFRDLLFDRRVSIDLASTQESDYSDQHVSIRPYEIGQAPFPLAIFAEVDNGTSTEFPDPISFVPTKYHAEVELILESAIEVDFRLERGTLTIEATQAHVR